MSLQVWFWLVIFMWLIGGAWVGRPNSPTWLGWGRDILLVLALLILGWAQFGAPVK